jgi:pimeloyl-ACP methyl ester carboxylesterase
MHHGRPALIVFVALFLVFSAADAQEKEPPQLPNRPSLLSYKISVARVVWNYVEAGAGSPLVFLHGLGGSWKDWADNLPAFVSKFRVVAVDFPGFGDSEKPEREYSVEWLTDALEKFLEDRNLERVQVVSHSMGALIALNLAARPGSRVKKLVVSDAVGIGDKADFLSYFMTRKIVGPESRWEPLEGLLRDELRSMIENFIKRGKAGTAKELFKSVPKIPIIGQPLLPMTPAVQMTASIVDFDIRPKLASIPQPTLVAWGARDPVVPPEHASLLKKGIRNSTLVIFPNSGHSPMMEEPLLFNDEVSRFLQAAEPAR